MMHKTLRIGLILAVGLLTPIAAAQDSSPAELRREIEDLRAVNETLAAQRDQIMADLTSLKEENQSLKDQLAEAIADIEELTARLRAAPSVVPESESTEQEQPVTVPETEPSAPVPEDHLASPASLYRALQKSFDEMFPNPVLNTEANKKRYEASVRRWARDMNTKLRGQTRWRVRVEDIAAAAPTQSNPRSTDATARMTVLDHETGLPIGRPFPVTVPSKMVSKLGGGPAFEYELRLLLLPKPVINSRRLEPGVFAWPPFIGPMTEFGFDFEWIGVRPYPKAEKGPVPATQTSPDENAVSSDDDRP